MHTFVLKLKVGNTAGVIIMSMVTGTPQPPASGVKVYGNVTTIPVKTIEGDQVPAIPLDDMVGNATALPWQKLVLKLKRGSIALETSTLMVIGCAH